MSHTNQSSSPTIYHPDHSNQGNGDNSDNIVERYESTQVDSLIIYVDDTVDLSLISKLEQVIKDVYPLQYTDRVNLSIFDMVKSTHHGNIINNDNQGQHINAEELLRLMIELWLPVTQQKIQTHHQYRFQHTAAMCITSVDCYAPQLNYIFGIARSGLGCIVSTYRLENNVDFIEKEIIHELGHVFGLTHCNVPCVMTFSNTIHDAQHKQKNLCQDCRNKIINDYHQDQQNIADQHNRDIVYQQQHTQDQQQPQPQQHV